MPDVAPAAARHEKYERLVKVAAKHPPLATAVAHPCDAASLEERGGSGADGPAPADPGRAAGAHTRGGRQGLARHRRLRAGRSPAQPRLGRQGRRARARRTGRSPDEGQPAYRRADGRRRGARYRHPHRPPHQPLLRHGRAGPFPGPDHLRRRREHRADARGEGRHRAERDRPCAGAHHRAGARGDPERHGDGQPPGAFDDRGGRAVQDGRSRPDHRRHPRRPARPGQRHQRSTPPPSSTSSRRSPARPTC